MTCYNSELPIGPPGPTGPIGPQGIPGNVILPYKLYTGIVSQSEGSNPTINVLLNDTDFTISLTRTFAGQYESNVFPGFTDKVSITCSISSFDTGVIVDGITLYLSKSSSGNTMSFIIKTLLNGTGLRDSLLNQSVLEIRVYP